MHIFSEQTFIDMYAEIYVDMSYYNSAKQCHTSKLQSTDKMNLSSTQDAQGSNEANSGRFYVPPSIHSLDTLLQEFLGSRSSTVD